MRAGPERDAVYDVELGEGLAFADEAVRRAGPGRDRKVSRD
ncbi:hypothetical protein [Streptomyces cinnamoneus]|nr:hypothetical protein [Streptomyces cinnamoneus]